MSDRGEAERDGAVMVMGTAMVTIMFLIPVPRMPWWGLQQQQEEVEVAPAAAAAASRMPEIMMSNRNRTCAGRDLSLMISFSSAKSPPVDLSVHVDLPRTLPY